MVISRVHKYKPQCSFRLLAFARKKSYYEVKTFEFICFISSYRSSDGKLLLISSTDGYCTLIAFEDGELGIPYIDPAKLAAADKVKGESSKVIGESQKVKTEEAVNKEIQKVITSSPDNRTVKQESTTVTETKTEKSPPNATSPGSTVTKTTPPPPQPSNNANTKG